MEWRYWTETSSGKLKDQSRCQKADANVGLIPGSGADEKVKP